MNLRFISIIGAVVAIALFMVFQATNESRATVLLPSELIQGVTKGANLSRIRVAGRVSQDPVEYSVSPGFTLKFRIRNPGPESQENPTIPVVYQGIKPDMFTSGRDVIIDGEFKEGTLIALKLLTQCPSKYEPPSPEKASQSKIN